MCILHFGLYHLWVQEENYVDTSFIGIRWLFFSYMSNTIIIEDLVKMLSVLENNRVKN